MDIESDSQGSCLDSDSLGGDTEPLIGYWNGSNNVLNQGQIFDFLIS